MLKIVEEPAICFYFDSLIFRENFFLLDRKIFKVCKISAEKELYYFYKFVDNFYKRNDIHLDLLYLKIFLS